MRYTESHEWVDTDTTSNIATIGVTHYAQKELGDIVYVELPSVGKDVIAGSEAAVLESTKAAADVYAPVSGKIVEVNAKLSTAPELVNSSSQTDGWIFKLKLSNPKELTELLDEAAYKAMTTT